MSDDVVGIVARSGYPADGVADHAAVLARESENAGLASSVVYVDWRTQGWRRALRELGTELATRRPRVVTLHYSTLAWGRRPSPFGLVALTVALRLRYRVLVWVHDPALPETSDARSRILRVVKSIGLTTAALMANATAVSIRPEKLPWARRRLVARKVLYCASPTNMSTAAWQPPDDRFTVATFGIAVGTEAHEAGPLRLIAQSLRDAVGPFRLRLLGARSSSARPPLADELEGIGVECDVPGYLEPDELASRLAASHIFVSVRYELSTRSGTVAAALACGLPIAGGAGPETSEELRAVALTTPFGEWEQLAHAIAALDDTALTAMAERSRALAASEYSWEPGIAVLQRLAAG
jgi:glycosyltransferase involved in cell wall biosynthesis